MKNKRDSFNPNAGPGSYKRDKEFLISSESRNKEAPRFADAARESMACKCARYAEAARAARRAGLGNACIIYWRDAQLSSFAFDLQSSILSLNEFCNPETSPYFRSETRHARSNLQH